MANKIQLRRGLKSAMPTGSAGEPLFATDTRELYVGTGSGNVNMGGSHWYRGTAMSGTSTTTNAYNYSACPQVKLDDMYLNTSNGNIYVCTTAGSGSSAKWTYQGCIKGATGAAGAKGATGANGEDGARSATIVIGLSTSGYTATEVDYLCDGTNDQTEIQAAIDALPSNGGKIIILEGTYTISSKLTCNKNIVFEGMGNGTIINCMTHALLYNTAANYRFIIKNIKFNNTGSFTNTNKFIQCADSDIVIDNCSISATVSSISETESNYISTTGNLTITNSDIYFDIRTYNNLSCTAFIDSQYTKETGSLGGLTKTILISNSNITLYNCYNITISSTSSNIYDAYILRDGGTISCCNIVCRGKKNSSGSFKAMANVVRKGNIVNCPCVDIIDTNSSINSYGGAVSDKDFDLIGNLIKLHGSYIGANRVIGNKFMQYGSGGEVRFKGLNCPIIIGNHIVNSDQNSFVALNSVIFTGNVLKRSCVISGLSTSVVTDNIVSDSIKL